MINLQVQYRKNDCSVLTPGELKQLYFFGVKIEDRMGTEISDETWYMNIRSAQEEIEKYLGIKLCKQIIQENQTFYRDEFEQFGFIRTNYPVVKPYGLDGFIGTIKQIQYPLEWLSSRLSNDGYSYNRQIYIVPNISTAKTGSIVYNGIVPYLGILGYSQVPNYWTITYITGYDIIPKDLLNVIGMLASLMMLGIASDLILGPGIGNQSLSIDGLSQSLNSKGFENRVKHYMDTIKTTLNRLRTNYKGVSISSM